jgi:hypothetical protein
MKKRIEIMADKTWDVIASDVLGCFDEDDPKMTREEVVEVVSDADYMKMYGGDKEAYEHWKSIESYEEKLALIRNAFPFSTYGF